MSDEKDTSELKIKKVVERKVKKAPPPTPPRYRYIAIHSVAEEPFSYEPFIHLFRKHGRTQRKNISRLIIYLILVNSIMGMSLIHSISIFCVQTILNDVKITRSDGKTIKIVMGETNWFINLLINILTETTVKSIPSNNTKSLNYADEPMTFTVDSNDRLLLVDVKVRLLGITLVEGRRYHGL
jgi:hypothetical protein